MLAKFLETLGVVKQSSRRTRHTIVAPAEVQVLESREMLSAITIHDWNDILLDTIRIEKPAPPMASRAMALVSTAVYDAVNSIDRRFESYFTSAIVSPLASKDAAAAVAAHRTLSVLFPARRFVFDVALNATLSTVPWGSMRDAGMEDARRAGARAESAPNGAQENGD